MCTCGHEPVQACLVYATPNPSRAERRNNMDEEKAGLATIDDPEELSTVDASHGTETAHEAGESLIPDSAGPYLQEDEGGISQVSKSWGT